jgi:hypothetical protein
MRTHLKAETRGGREMRIRVTRRLTLLMALALVVGVMAVGGTAAVAAGETYAQSVVNYDQGAFAGSQPATTYWDPNNALGAPDSEYASYTTFTALGIGGSIVLDMGAPVAGNVTVVETTYGPYPAETAEVSVSPDGTTWVSVGEASSGRPGSSPTVRNLTTLEVGEGCFQYVKLVDTSDTTGLTSYNGFDVDAVMAENDIAPVCEIEVSIDIKPGSFPNAFNINGHGVIPVAILGSADFDVTQINNSTLVFGGLSVRTKGNGDAQCSIKDVSGDFTYPEGAPDGYADLVCQFVDADGVVFVGNGTASVDGFLYDGTPFHGEDTIKLVNE